jgi:DNA invertase Pin-like site-specific DNA recombinase
MGRASPLSTGMFAPDSETSFRMVQSYLRGAEVESLRERIKSGLVQAKRKGVKLGRPKGTTLGREIFLQKHKDILRQLKAGQSVRNAAKITGKGASTVQRVKLAMEW